MTCHRDHVRPTDAGYTLLEVLAVIGILALMTSALMVSWPVRFEDRLDVVSERIRLSLIAAREAAMRTNEPARVVFDLKQRRWSGFDGRTSELPEEIRIEVTAARKLSEAQDLGVAFMPQGSSTGGTIELSDDTGRAVVTIDWLTGRIAIARRDD